MRPDDLEHLSRPEYTEDVKVYCDICHTWARADEDGEPVEHECEEYIPTPVDFQELQFDE